MTNPAQKYSAHAAPVKVLYVIDHFKNPNAGTEGQLYQLIKHLDRQKYAPQLLLFSDSAWLQKSDFPCPVEVIGSSSLSSPKTWWRLFVAAQRFRRAGGRLAHVFFNDPSIICPPVFKLCAIQTIISRRDMGYWYTNRLKKLLNLTRRCCSGVVVNSQAVAEITCASEGFSKADVTVIYNGYEAQNNPLSNIAELAAIKGGGRQIVGLVANIRPIKRIDDMIKALAVIKDSAPLLDFVHIGDGDSSELKALAKRLGVGERVHFLGPRADIKSCLQYFDLAALCSQSEGFSNAIVEYLQSGIPVVCSRVGGNPEAVRSGFNGCLYDCGDVDALAKGLSELVLNKETRLLYSKNAQQQANERYTVEAMIESHQVLYRSLGG